ncbi:inositol polyphosphate multikinase-like [Centruroides vittatus]|uniref:inositol polyphosphate multikinase-like n=1 Tax=Centruroides vittatus TaxID=120091 RepID=UPI003510A2B3
MQETNKINKNLENESRNEREATFTSDNVTLDKSRKSSSKLNTEQNEDFPLPENTRILEHQIAGHQHGQGRTKLGVLKHNDGSILKPMIKNDPRGIRELEFYEKVFHNGNNTGVSVLQSLLPRFKGTWETTINGNGIKYLCIEDVTEAFVKPCILDIKVGPCTYDPEASPEKILHETIKYPTSTITGFRILGMRIKESLSVKLCVFSKPSKGFERDDKKVPKRGKLRIYFVTPHGKVLYFDKHYGRQQTPETIADALFLYLNKSYETTVHAILCGFLHKLHAIENWFKVQRTFAFYSSSILFVYEGDRSVWDRCNREIGAINKLTFIPNCKEENAAKTISRSNLNSSAANPGVGSECRGGSCSVCGLSSEVCGAIRRRNDRPPTLLDVRMIDFAHVFPSDKTDQNYLFGLKRLVGYLKVLQVRIWRQ